MRIALVSQEYPPAPHGGLGSQTQLKAHGLADFGHDIQVISHSLNGTRQEYRDRSVRVTRIPNCDNRLVIHSEPVRWLTWSMEVATALADLHARDPFDLVDFAEWGGEGYVHLLNRRSWNYVPAVVQLHGPMVMLAHSMEWPDKESEFYRVATSMEATCLRLADAVFSSSYCSIDWCVRHYGLDPEQIPVLHAGIDTDLFQPVDGAKESCPTIVFVGKLVKNKGVELLVDAACQLVREFPDLRLWLIGTGEPHYVRAVQNKVELAGASGLLQLKGFASRQQLAALLQRAHVFAAPSVYEGGPGFVYLEAMACSLPVIACAGSGAAEAVTHSETGILIPPNDSDALVDALRNLLINERARAEIGKRGRQYVLQHANSSECLKRLETFYAAVAKRCRPKAN